MPTATEVVPNTPLSGTELKEIIKRDFERLLEADGMLSNHLAFGKVGYRITVELQLNNPLMPQSKSVAKSRHPARNAQGSDTAKAVEDYDEKQENTRKGQRQRIITSPNSERLRNEMPIPVQRRQQDGTIVTEQVKYPRDESMGDGDVVEVVEVEKPVEAGEE